MNTNNEGRYFTFIGVYSFYLCLSMIFALFLSKVIILIFY